jgi:hypothetical protein
MHMLPKRVADLGGKKWGLVVFYGEYLKPEKEEQVLQSTTEFLEFVRKQDKSAQENGIWIVIGYPEAHSEPEKNLLEDIKALCRREGIPLFVARGSLLPDGWVRYGENLSTVTPILRQHLPGFRLAKIEDMTDELRDVLRHEANVDLEPRFAIQADYNGDGADDLGLLVVNDKSKEVRIYYALRKRDEYRLVLLLTDKLPAGWKGNLVRVPMFFKPSGDYGMGMRRYSTILPEMTEDPTPAMEKEWERRVAAYQAVPAIEVWTGAIRQDAPYLNWCSQTWYYQTNKLLTFDACD